MLLFLILDFLLIRFLFELLMVVTVNVYKVIKGKVVLDMRGLAVFFFFLWIRRNFIVRKYC